MGQNKKKSYSGVTKIMLILRAAVAAYIIYIAYSLLEGYIKGDGLPLYLLIICGVIFAGIGGTVFVLALKSLINGEYAGGKADAGVCGDGTEEAKDYADSDSDGSENLYEGNGTDDAGDAYSPSSGYDGVSDENAEGRSDNAARENGSGGTLADRLKKYN